MTDSSVKLELQPRELLGKKVGRLRRAGIIPVHFYGPGIESKALQCAGRQLIPALVEAGTSSPITVTIEGESGSYLAFAREIQWDPTRDTVLHVDFMSADVSRPVTAQVGIVLEGEAPGAVRSGGSVSQMLFTLDVSALPLDMPAQAEVDLAVMTTEDSVIRAGDIPLSEAVALLTDPDEMVARIDIPRGEMGVEAEEEGHQEEPAAGEPEESE